MRKRCEDLRERGGKRSVIEMILWNVKSTFYDFVPNKRLNLSKFISRSSNTFSPFSMDILTGVTGLFIAHKRSISRRPEKTKYAFNRRDYALQFVILSILLFLVPRGRYQNVYRIITFLPWSEEFSRLCFTVCYSFCSSLSSSKKKISKRNKNSFLFPCDFKLQKGEF